MMLVQSLGGPNSRAKAETEVLNMARRSNADCDVQPALCQLGSCSLDCTGIRCTNSCNWGRTSAYPDSCNVGYKSAHGAGEHCMHFPTPYKQERSMSFVRILVCACARCLAQNLTNINLTGLFLPWRCYHWFQKVVWCVLPWVSDKWSVIASWVKIRLHINHCGGFNFAILFDT